MKQSKLQFLIFRKRQVLFLSGLLLGACFVVPKTGWLSIVAMAMMAFYVSHIKTYRKSQVMFDLFVYGLIVGGFSLAFIFGMDPNSWGFYIGPASALLLQMLAWVPQVTVFALPYLLLGYFLAVVPRLRYRLMLIVVGLPLIEVLRAYLLSLLYIGPGSTVGTNFNWGSIAVVASGTPMVFASRLVGFYGLTSVVAIAGVGLYLLLTKHKLKGFLILLLVACVSLAGWSQNKESTGSRINVAAVHLNSSSSFLTNKQIVNSVPQNTQLLVLPEHSGVVEGGDLPSLAAKLSSNGVGITSYIAGGEDATNRLVFFNKNGETISAQDKTLLAPAGEYIPYILGWAAKLLGQEKLIKDFQLNRQIAKGSRPELPVKFGEYSVGALACSGVLSLRQYSALSTSGADVLVNVASLSTLSRGGGYELFSNNLARFHAVSNKKPMIVASRSGQSLIYDAQGKLIRQYNGSKNSVLTASIELSNRGGE